jgi:hypothetical protein
MTRSHAGFGDWNSQTSGNPEMRDPADNPFRQPEVNCTPPPESRHTRRRFAEFVATGLGVFSTSASGFLFIWLFFALWSAPFFKTAAELLNFLIPALLCPMHLLVGLRLMQFRRWSPVAAVPLFACWLPVSPVGTFCGACLISLLLLTPGIWTVCSRDYEKTILATPEVPPLRVGWMFMSMTIGLCAALLLQIGQVD